MSPRQTQQPKTEEVLAKLEENGILGGYPTEKGVIFCTTELVTKSEIDRAVKLIGEVIA